jgi:hypothetical protein
MNDRFLVDEDLTPELVSVAWELGFEAHHVAHFGLSGKPDRVVFEKVLEGGFVFVSNNREDWNSLVSKVDLHGGLIIIRPRCRRDVQKALFRAALVHAQKIGGLLNKVLEIDGSATIAVFDVPRPAACRPADESLSTSEAMSRPAATWVPE